MTKLGYLDILTTQRLSRPTLQNVAGAPDMRTFHGLPLPVLKASTASELRQHVDKLINDADFSRAYVSEISVVLEDAFGPTDSCASMRLAKLCAELAGKHAATAEPAEIP